VPGEFLPFICSHSDSTDVARRDTKVIYIWMLPDQLLLPSSYSRSHFNALQHRNRLSTLIGHADGALRVSQQVRVSRFVSDQPTAIEYVPTASDNGVYVFVVEGSLECDDMQLGRRDSTGIWGAERLHLRSGREPVDVLIVETAP
jgi:redox-sensitive bicupin YhaK (pirin superfamily)